MLSTKVRFLFLPFNLSQKSAIHIEALFMVCETFLRLQKSHDTNSSCERIMSARRKKQTLRAEAEKTGEVVGKGVKKVFGIAKGIGKGLVKGVKGEEEKQKKKE